MRFLHLSDLHIGRRLSGISLLDDQRAVLAQAVEMAGECDAVLLAGDLYDKPQPPSEAIRAVSDFLVALRKLEKPVFAVSGNHDAPEQVAYCRELLGRCGVFLSPAFDGRLHGHTLRDACGEVRVWLMPFLRPSAVRPYFEDVRTFEDAVRAALSTAVREPGVRHVLVAHQYVTGAATCDSEALSLGGADQVSASLFEGFDYVALGHLHSPQKLCGGRVRYCGSPLKYSLSEERQRKAALLVDLGPEGLREVARQCYDKAHYFAERLAAIGLPRREKGPFFHEFATECPGGPEKMLVALEERDILGGQPMGDGRVLWCVTEKAERKRLDEAVAVIREVTNL